MEKTCENCHQVFRKNKDTSVRIFREVKKYCSNKCKWESNKKDVLTYNTIHTYRLKTHPKSGVCEHCGLKKFTQWSNKSGDYKRHDNDDWQELCVRCHRIYDYNRQPLSTRSCVFCKKDFEARNPIKVYCSKKCISANKRMRNKRTVYIKA